LKITKTETAVSSPKKRNRRNWQSNIYHFPENNLLIISYVMVYPKFEGQGFGKKLVEESIQFARENKWQVNPHCSYARSVMTRMQGIEDVFSK
jgi:predicted GNAT family acetyltransferase